MFIGTGRIAPKRIAMDIAATKLELMQQLMSIMDEKTLRKVASFFKKEVAVEEDDITDEELVEFDRQHAAYMSGELKGISGKESVKQLRKAQERDEAV